MLESGICWKIEGWNVDFVFVFDLDVDLQVVGSAERRVALKTNQNAVTFYNRNKKLGTTYFVRPKVPQSKLPQKRMFPTIA